MKTALDILAVDDHPDYLFPLKLLLQADGHNAVIVSSGDEALQQIKQKNFDLLIIDVHLKDMDGIDLCRQIHESCQRTTIVVHSACVEEKDRKRGYDAGATMYLGKPEGMDTILSVANAMRSTTTALQ